MHRYLSAIFFTFLWSVFVLADDIHTPRQQPVKTSGINIAAKGNTALAVDTLIQYLVNQTNLDSLTRHVNILSGEDSVTLNGSAHLILSRNASHSHNDLAADYIFQTLDRLGLPTYNQQYSSDGRNVYSVQVGTDYPDKQFIICAHYDDMPFQPAPGADDNASGTAAVLEAARILSQIPTPYTIIYALWDEEEIGLLGSAYYAQQAYMSSEDILGVVNLEMFGWDGNDDGLIDIHTRPIARSVELADLIEYLEGDYNMGLSPAIYNPGTTASDHSSFWNYGYSAVVFSEAFYGGDSNPFYHTSNDRIAHFNLAYFFALSKLAVATISHLSFYNIVQVNLENQDNVFPADFVLEQNYPNPFNPTTNIGFRIGDFGFVSLKVYDVTGREVVTLVAENLMPGNYEYQWDAQGLASGMYFYRLEAKGFMEMKKMVLVR
jgi:hypothetical protein